MCPVDPIDGTSAPGDRPAGPPYPDGKAALIRCVYCGHLGAVRFEWREQFEAKELGTFSLSGQTMKWSALRSWWPWAVCRSGLGGCGHESKGKR